MSQSTPSPARIKAALALIGWRQKDLAAAIGMPQKLLDKRLQGRTRISDEEMDGIAVALKVGRDDLCTGTAGRAAEPPSAGAGSGGRHDLPR